MANPDITDQSLARVVMTTVFLTNPTKKKKGEKNTRRLRTSSNCLGFGSYATLGGVDSIWKPDGKGEGGRAGGVWFERSGILNAHDNVMHNGDLGVSVRAGFD